MSTTVAPEGRKLLRVEARNAQTPIERKPKWLRTRAVISETYQEVRGLVGQKRLHTVCAEANCPNIYECWNDREASFLIGGEMCTRRCDFCDIATGRPTAYDEDEPARVAASVAQMRLRYATVTGVARDDRPDGGAWLYAEVARQIHAAAPGCGVELLVPDFRGDRAALEEVFSAAPEVFAHNLETVPRIFRRIRPAFSYEGSLSVLRRASEAGLLTKSNLILGMGETRDEIEAGHRGPRGPRRRHPDHHPVHAPLQAAPPHRPVGQAPGVRRTGGRGRGDGHPGGHERPHGALLLPLGHALGPGHAGQGPPHPGGDGRAGRARHGPPGGLGPSGRPARRGLLRPSGPGRRRRTGGAVGYGGSS